MVKTMPLVLISPFVRRLPKYSPSISVLTTLYLVHYQVPRRCKTSNIADEYQPFKKYKIVNLIPNNGGISVEKVLSFHDVITEHGVSDRHDLQSKLETLEALGCTLDQIQESPEVLQIPLDEIVLRAAIIQKQGYKKMSVLMLKVARSDMTQAQLKKMEDTIKVVKDYRTITDYMIEVLECNQLEFHTILKKVPTMKKLRNMSAFTDKVKYLRSIGATSEDLKKHPNLFCYSLQTLQKRVKKIKERQQDKCFPISSLAVSQSQFNKFLSKYNVDQRVLGDTTDRYECIAKLLDVPVSMAKEMKYFENRRLATIKPRINYMLSIGIPLEHIRSHTYILRHKTETLKKAYEKAQEAGIEKISILHIIHIIVCNSVPMKPPFPKSGRFLPKLLGISKVELVKKKEHFKPLVITDQITLKANFEYLMSIGITKEEMCSCPLILSHNPEQLKAGIDSIRQQPEMQNNLDLLSNGTSLVNLVQYFLEKELNFRFPHLDIV